MSIISIELDLPTHTRELEDTEEYCKTLKEKYNEFKISRVASPMSDKEYESLYDSIMKGLYYLGYLSQPAFDVEDIIEEKYFQTYKHSPELAKKLWWDHYESVHRPYTLLKNRLFKLIDDLNDLYFLIHKKTPANY